MNERDADRAEAVRQIAAILAAAYLRLRFPGPPHRQSHSELQIGRREGTGSEGGGPMKNHNETLEIEITIDLVKGHNGHRRNAAVPKAPDPPRIPRIARLMALAIKFQDMVDRGEVRDYADLAQRGYVSRARITQIMNLLHLAPEGDFQERLLDGVPWQSITSERHLRPVTRSLDWAMQRALFAKLCQTY